MKTTKKLKATVMRKALIVAAGTLLAVCSYRAKAAVKLQESDTTRKNVVIVEAGGLRTTDSMDYVINGRKSTRDEFEKIKYGDIMSVNWVSAENAARIFDNGDNSHNILFVTTRNSEAGKKMLAKVNTVKNHKGQVFSEKANGVYAMVDGKFTELKPGNAAALTLAEYNEAGEDGLLAINAGGTRNAIAVGYSRPEIYTLGSSNNARPYVVGSGRAYSRSGKAHDIGYAVAGTEIESARELSNLKDKLIVINDKEATAADLKKVSAFDIDRMTFKDDEHTRHQYGDKAKNGVVYIYTKKSKK